MSDILKIIEQKRNFIRAETPSNEQVTLFVIFDAILENRSNYLLVEPVNDKSNSIIFRRTRTGKTKSLVPANGDEANELVELYKIRNAREVIERLTETGEPLSKSKVRRYVRTKGVAVPADIRFAVVEIWVVINGQLLLLQRHPDKDFGLKWECPGGTVRYGEKYPESAQRELYEETGIFAEETEFTYLGVTKRSNWFCHSYLLNLADKTEPKVNLQKEECVDCKLISINEIEGFLIELTEGHKETFLKYRDAILSLIAKK